MKVVGNLRLKNVNFDGLDFNIYVDESGEIFMTRKQIVESLGYSRSRMSIKHKNVKDNNFSQNNQLNCYLYNKEGVFDIMHNSINNKKDKIRKLLRYMGFNQNKIEINIRGYKNMKNDFTFKEDVVIIKIFCKGSYHDCLIDREDFGKVNVHGRTWVGRKHGNTIYAEHRPYCNGKRFIVNMHHVIMDFEGYDGVKMIDHLNGDGLDNRKSNLRVATYVQNNRNIRLKEGNVYGVNKRDGKWRTSIGVNGKQITLGSFEDKNEAIRVRREAELKYWNKEDIRRLNDERN